MEEKEETRKVMMFNAQIMNCERTTVEPTVADVRDKFLRCDALGVRMLHRVNAFLNHLGRQECATLCQAYMRPPLTSVNLCAIMASVSLAVYIFPGWGKALDACATGVSPRRPSMLCGWADGQNKAGVDGHAIG